MYHVRKMRVSEITDTRAYRCLYMPSSSIRKLNYNLGPITRVITAVCEDEEFRESTDRQNAEEMLSPNNQVAKLQQDKPDILERFDWVNVENKVIAYNLRSELVATNTPAATVAGISLQNDNFQSQTATLESENMQLTLDNAEETSSLKRQIVELQGESSDIRYQCKIRSSQSRKSSHH